MLFLFIQRNQHQSLYGYEYEKKKGQGAGWEGGRGALMMYHHACNDYPYSERRDNFNVGVFIMKNERFIVAVGFFV